MVQFQIVFVVGRSSIIGMFAMCNSIIALSSTTALFTLVLTLVDGRLPFAGLGKEELQGGLKGNGLTSVIVMGVVVMVRLLRQLRGSFHLIEVIK